jgi:two-component system response regulator YesN
MFSLLIVDDEPLMRDFMKVNIPSIDSDWIVAGEAQDGIQALEFMEKQNFDLVITDIKMPVMDGLELCEKIKAINKQQEIVILSGYDEFSFAQEAMKYKVHGYLLKPIKIAALKDILSEVAKQIQAKNKDEIAYRTMQNLSIDYQSHICRSYLRAIIENSHTEIRTLHPMIHKMKIDLIQAESIIMILKLDIESIINQKIPLKDITIFQYILFQSTTEIIEEHKAGFAVLDSNENTVVYITGEDSLEIEQKCIDIYSTVSSFLEKHAGITITGSIGSAKSDVLEMYLSYTDAFKILKLGAIKSDNTLYSGRQIGLADLNRISTVEKSYTSLIVCLIENNEAGLQIALNNYIDTMDSLSISSIIRYILLLLDNFKEFKTDFGIAQYELCVNQMINYTSDLDKSYSKNSVVTFFLEIIKLGWGNSTETSEEPSTQKLTKESKEFIYQHFSEPITLSQIADNFKVSPNYLSKIFHENVGESYIKFITRIRMEYAAKLLKTKPNERIYNIAEKVGYYNLKHFNFVFKEYYNMTPSEYQKS